jgi:hypothetical protein
MNKVGWTDDERHALLIIAKRYTEGEKKKQKPAVSIRLYQQGYVTKDPFGELRVTEKGQTLLHSLQSRAADVWRMRAARAAAERGRKNGLPFLTTTNGKT